MTKQKRRIKSRGTAAARALGAVASIPRRLRAALAPGREPGRRGQGTKRRGSDRSVLSALRKQQQHLRDELARQELLVQDHPATGHHMADDASDVTEEVTDLALRRHLEGLLEGIERAIVRAEQGTYGSCERCGRPIDAERLRAVPWVSLCIDCAKAQVQLGKAESRSTR